MTTTFVVPVEMIGRIAKRQNDLIGRVMETKDPKYPKRVFDGLQLLMEDKPLPRVETLPVEDYPFVFSDRRYRVAINRKACVYDLAREFGLSTEQWAKEITDAIFPSSGGPKKGLYGLARFTNITHQEKAHCLLEECGVQMVDVWELITLTGIITHIKFPQDSFLLWALDTMFNHSGKFKTRWCVDHRSMEWYPKELRPYNDAVPIQTGNLVLVRYD